MKQLCTLLAILICSSWSASAQQYTTFHRGYEDTTGYNSFGVAGYTIGSDLAEMPNGDFLAALNYGLIRTDDTGHSKWIYTYSRPGMPPLPQNPATHQVIFSQVLPLSDGGAMALGALHSTLPDTAVICRLDASGTVLWAKTVTAPAPQSLQIRDAALTANGELLVCLFSNFSPSVVGDYAIVMRMSLSGSVLWQRYFTNYSAPPFNPQLRTWDASECGNGDFLISGFGNTPDTNVVLRITSTGDLRWAKSYNCGNPLARRAFQRVKEVTGGKIAVAMGDAFGNYGNGYLLLDSTGGLTSMQKAFKDSAFYSNAIIRPNGDMLMVTRNKMYLVDINGNIQFAHRYLPPTAPVYLTALCATADGGYAAGGSYLIATSYIYFSGYLVKTDPDGQAPPYVADFTLTDTTCNCTSTATALLDTAVSFPVIDIALQSHTVYLHDTLFAQTLDVRTATAQPAEVSVYPNPAQDRLYFSGHTALNAALYSSDGRLMADYHNVRSIDISSLAPGLYWVHLRDVRGRDLGVQKVQKK